MTQPFPIADIALPRRISLAPATWLLAAGAALMAALLAAPIDLPIGPSFWDLVMYIDAAHRIDLGQQIHRDVHSVFGPLSHYGYWAFHRLIPWSQPIFAAQLPYGIAFAGLLAAALRGVPQRLALGLAAYFLLIAIFPINFPEFPEPYLSRGAAAYGIYNRQAAMGLYVLACAVLALPGPRQATPIVAVALAILFFTKITTFAAALGVCAVLGHFRGFGWRWLVAALAPLAAAALALEALTGMVSDYVKDALLVLQGSYGLVQRLSDAAHLHIQTLVLSAVMTAALMISDREQMHAALHGRGPATLRVGRLLALPGVTFALVAAGAFAIESQNTGSASFPYLVPVAVLLVWRSRGADGPRGGFAAMAAAALVGVLGVTATEKAVRLGLGYMTQAPYGDGLFRDLHVRVNPLELETARGSLTLYAEHAPVFDAASRIGLDRAFLYRREWQVTYLMSVQEAADAYRTWRGEGAPRQRLATIDFVDPFPWVLDAEPMRRGGVVLAVDRTLSPRFVARIEHVLHDADGVFVPHCAMVGIRRDLVARLGPALAGRSAVRMGRCWTLYVKPDGAR